VNRAQNARPRSSIVRSQQRQSVADPDEGKIAAYLADRELVTTRFSKEERRSGKTPDFRVSVNETVVAYCEVKSIVRDTWLDRLLAKASPGEIRGGPRNDPIFNRLTDDIHKAVQQFDVANPDCALPNILGLVNHDRNCGFLDLLAVLTGNFYGTEGSQPIYRQFSEGRIKDEKARIHAYIWLDDFRPTRVLFSRTHADHHSRLCELLGFDDKDLRDVDS
jgi:hypothetical protein